MEKSAIFHQSDSIYSFPMQDGRACIRVRTKRDDTICSVNVIWNTAHRYYLERFSEPMVKRYQGQLSDYYEAYIGNGNPGYAYVIQFVETDGTTWYYNESGFSQTLNVNTSFEDNFTVVYPNEKDIVVANPVFEGRVFYQIFPERFAKGSKKTNTQYIDMEWDTDEPDNLRFAGGDLDGVREKLPYLKDLGIDAIYLNPIHPSVSAHKYDVDDYLAIDPMFGSMDTLKQLVAEAHQLDIKIVLDLVFNHSSFYNPMFQDVVNRGKDSPYYHWYFVQGDKPTWEEGNYETFCGVKMMPKLNTNNPEVQEYLCQVSEYYIREAGVDGYRLDVAFDVSHDFWRVFKKRLIALNPHFFVIGEDWLNSVSFLGNDQWDSVMNYPIMYACYRYLLHDKYTAADVAGYLNDVLMRYKDGHNRNMLNLIDSHDTVRFFTMAEESIDRSLMGFAILMWYLGLPMLYYGDEILMDGKGDPYNRKCMRWQSPMWQSEAHQVMRTLLRYRHDPILMYGDMSIAAEGDMLRIVRTYQGRSLTLYVNHSTQAYPLSDVIYGYNCSDGVLQSDGFAIVAE